MPSPAGKLLFQQEHLKNQLSLSVKRLHIFRVRDKAKSIALQRKAIDELEKGEEVSALMLVEESLLVDDIVHLYEKLSHSCQRLAIYVALLDDPALDPKLEKYIKNILYAVPKMAELKGLVPLRNLLAEKFGREFVQAAMENRDEAVDPIVVKRSAVTIPSEDVVRQSMAAIAKFYRGGEVAAEAAGGPEPADLLIDGLEEEEAELEPPLLPGTGPDAAEAGDEDVDAAAPGEGAAKAKGKAASPKDEAPPRTVAAKPAAAKAPPKAVEAPKKKSDSSGKGASGGIPDISELERRFQALKRS